MEIKYTGIITSIESFKNGGVGMDNIELCQQCSAADSAVCDSLPHLCGRCEAAEAANADAE